MLRPLRLFNSYSLRWQHFILYYTSSDSSPLLYTLAIRVVYGFGIRLHGMCEVTPYMEATTTSHNIPHFAMLYHLYTMVQHFDLYLKCGTYVW